MTRWVENFHLGKPILVMLVIAVCAGTAAALRPGQEKADLNVWVFADSHYQSFKPLIPAFEREHNVKVNLNLLSGRAIALRLGQLFMSNKSEEQMPDLVEMEIGLVGRFFRPPVEEVGYLPLNDRLKESGWYDKLVQTRFAPWSKEGVIFGVPHDVHPCVIAYRDDLFREAGIDLSQAKTWPAFQEACLKFERYWKSKGFKYRHALELPEASSDYLQVMLLQRGINPIDSFGNVYLEDPRVAETLAFYAQLVAGPRKVTAQTSAGMGAWSKDIVDGNLCAFLIPDWRLTYLKRYGAKVSGKMRLMPVPVFDPGDAPTSTWGGTMMGITKRSKHPELAWKLLEYLYFSEAGLKSRQDWTAILPPIKAYWNQPMYHKPDPYYGGQKADELLTDLAAKIPARYVTPATPIATMALNEAVARAGEYVKERGNADGLEERCREWLAEISTDLRERMDQWRFD